MKLRLVRNGVFPVRENHGAGEGNTFKTGFSIPGTIQGEGKLAGIPSIFIRTTGCNLRCTWKNDLGMVDICDTAYSSHHVRDFEEWEIAEIVETVGNNLGNIRHAVITGGEPCLQPEAVVKLASMLKKQLKIRITIETNGTIYVPELASNVDFFSISPKLRSSEPDQAKNKILEHPVEEKFIRDHSKFRVNTAVIQKYINSCLVSDTYYNDLPATPVRSRDKDFQLKFVIARKEDENEIRNDFLSKLGNVNPEDVLVMPLGSTPEKTIIHAGIAAEMAIRNGWRYAPRIHLDLFGDMEGV